MDSLHARANNELFARPVPPAEPEATTEDVSVVSYRKPKETKGSIEESLPLIDAESSAPAPPPNAKPEADDLYGNDDERTLFTKPHPGVDDGFFDPENPDAETFPLEDVDDDDFNFSNRAGEGGIDGVPKKFNGGAFPIPELGVVYTGPESIPDVNIYQHKKTVAQGMMDLALFSANANQLRYVMESSNHPYFWPGVVLIAFSLIFQIAVGVGLLMNTRYNVKDKREICIANKINNFTIIGIFLITVINVFISAFGVVTNTSAPSSTGTS